MAASDSHEPPRRSQISPSTRSRLCWISRRAATGSARARRLHQAGTGGVASVRWREPLDRAAGEVDIPAGGAVTYVHQRIRAERVDRAREDHREWHGYRVVPGLPRARVGHRGYRESATTTTAGVAATAAPTRLRCHRSPAAGAYWICWAAPAGGPAGGWTLTTVNCGGVLVLVRPGRRRGEADPCTPQVALRVHGHPLGYPAAATAGEPAAGRASARAGVPIGSRPARVPAQWDLRRHQAGVGVDRDPRRRGRLPDHGQDLGPSPAQHVVLADQPLGHAPFVAVQTSAGHCKARLRTVVPITCGLGTLQPGGKVTVTVRLRIETAASSSQTQPSRAPRRRANARQQPRPRTRTPRPRHPRLPD